jgi:FtsH-binding integral membrane protein
MATTAHETHFTKPVSHPAGRWFFVGMALVMIATSIAGFLPAIIEPATRRAPLTLLAEAHGIVFFMWLLLYLAQSLLIANRRVALHRRLGLTSVVLLAAMIPLGFATTTAMVRRGFDLSGDQHVDPRPDGQTSVDAPTASVFNLAALLPFIILAVAATGYRRRPNIHKRLMLWANITLMIAPIAHLFGHIPSTWLPPAAADAAAPILTILFLLAPIAGDYLIEKRIRFLTAAMATGLFAYQQLVIFVIAPSAAWHRFAEWMSQ